MIKFLFITHLTPVSKRSVLREKMFGIMQESLHKQTYKHWKALFIGEKEALAGKIKEVDITKSNDLSNIYLRTDVLEYINECDYIVKLDDDDVILPKTLEIASKFEFDCYCDAYHTFYDITSASLTQQKRSWIAATCIHRKEHAIMHQNGKQIADNFIHSIFYGEHGRDWINYYKHKNLIYAKRNNPLYVRILSPTSITAGAKVFPVKSMNDVDMNDYYNYLKEFGAWNKFSISEFDFFKYELSTHWEAFSGTKTSPVPGISFFEKLKAKVKYALNK
jgi:hypothetical protein